jgi:cadmium resistance protein CadD (predicted permease)
VAALAATNVDDVVLLAIFFARRDERFGTRQIVLGQYLGFAFLIVVSALGAAGAMLLPDTAVRLLGLVPLALGLVGLVQALRGGADEDAGDAPTAGLRLDTGRVTAITIANGADNAAIYVPLFASAGIGGMGLTSAIFLVLVAPLLLVSWAIGSRPAVERIVERAGAYAVPIVLIALGVFILAGVG